MNGSFAGSRNAVLSLPTEFIVEFSTEISIAKLKIGSWWHVYWHISIIPEEQADYS
jgi:hypothetical protein